MKEFFAAMEPAQQFYWYLAIGISIIFIIQTVMTFIGMDSDAGVDADFDGNLDVADHPFQLFSLRNLISFLLGFGWTGASLYPVIDNQILLAIVAFIVGALFVAAFFLIMRSLMKLAEDNSFNIEDAIGKTADVYTTIPPNKSGKGKVFISVKGTTHELDAITTNGESLTVGMLVKVIEIEGNILVVNLLK
ncbi:MAG: NfeD family protein [Dysgonomonas sp.]